MNILCESSKKWENKELSASGINYLNLNKKLI